jgi:hypothetical protein
MISQTSRVTHSIHDRVFQQCLQSNGPITLVLVD